jgi:hypothetical protein
MIERLFVVLYFCQINTILFFVLSYIMPELLAVNISMIITVGAFMSDRNKKYRDLLKQQEIWVSKEEYSRRYSDGRQ